EAALLVANDDGPPHGWAHDGSSTPHVERLRTAPGDHPGDRCVAGDSARRGRIDGTRVVELALSTKSLQSNEVDGHGDVWPLAGDVRSVEAIQPSTADLSQRIGPALGGRPTIGRPVRSG